MKNERTHEFWSLITTTVLAISLIISVLTCFSAFYTLEDTSLKAVYLLLPCLAAIIFPVSSIAIFIFLLPLFGNRPGTNQAYYLFLYSASLQVGLSINYFFSIKKTASLRSDKNNAVAFFLACYFIVSILSLTSLPWLQIINNIKSQLPSIWDLSALSYNTLNFLRSTEEKINYSVLSVIWTMFALNIANLTLLHSKKNRLLPLQLVAVLLASLLLSLSIGILDYYSLIDLSNFRSLDPVVNPSGNQFRMQSFFGHSGWFAEYVTLTIASCMILLLLPIRFSARIGLIIPILLIGELCLILSFQRGGWISYPLTLFVIWTGIYVCYKIEKNEVNFLSALKSSLIKICVSVPATLLISLLFLMLVTRDANNQTNILSRYVNRISDIQKTSDRTDFFKAGLFLGILHPYLGGGSESFAFRFREEFVEPNGDYYQDLNLPLHGTSHNVYMQTFAGKGVGGLLFLLLTFGSVIVLAVNQVLNSKIEFKEKIFLLFVSCLSAAFLIYGNVQEIFYIQSLQYITFIFTLLSIVYLSDKLAFLSYKTCNFILTVVLCLLLAHITWEFSYLPNFSKKDSYGCFDIESAPDKSKFQWCGVRARTPFPVTWSNNQYSVKLKLEAAQTRNPLPQSLLVRINSQDISTIELTPGHSQSIELTIPKELEKNIADKYDYPLIFLELITGNYFIPARDWKNTEDSRILSYKLYR